MKKHVNHWNSFSRGLFVALFLVAIFCGICAFGAAFSEVPWLLISGAVCFVLFLSVLIWVLGYLSHKAEEYREELYDEYENETEQNAESTPSKDIRKFDMFPESNEDSGTRKAGKFERSETPEASNPNNTEKK